ncbi:MAG TPA: sigma-70 family RNA polymerase sigma factor [Lacunisphaera sp.]|jgi:RNA polymerase sigma factor (sigma-70 family)
MQSDAELLRLYADSESQEAFATLVQRHLPFAYSAALRQVAGNSHHAQEVVQTVFTLLARKARRLCDHPSLVGWLYTTTHYTAAKLRRTEQRRAHAEGGAMNEAETSSGENWEQLRPVIDELMLKLKERDRIAVLLRFFSNHTYHEIGRRLGLSENAARMRVDRALDSLRDDLGRRGIASTSAALGTLLATQAVGAVPEGLAATISVSAMPAAVGGGSLFLMNATLVKIGVVAGMLAVGSAGMIVHHRTVAENTRLHTELAAAQNQLAALNARRDVSMPVVRAVDRAGISEAQPPSQSNTVVKNQEEDRRNAPDPERMLTHLNALRNVGRATPSAAIQTILWAITHGDENLPDMLFLNKAALKEAREMMVALPMETRASYETPEKLAALYLSKYVLEQIDTVQIQGVTQLDPETVEVKILTGEKGPTTVSMQGTPNGWMWKVKASLIEAAKQDLLGVRAVPVVPAR